MVAEQRNVRYSSETFNAVEKNVEAGADVNFRGAGSGVERVDNAQSWLHCTTGDTGLERL